ncbi:MAG: hypothetical protein IPO08_09380 [Xanthomonadales bacterium]|nr:hypothetical protein [Xanthomonadales bacterium]
MPLLREVVQRTNAAVDTDPTLVRQQSVIDVDKRDLRHPYPLRERIQGP